MQILLIYIILLKWQYLNAIPDTYLLPSVVQCVTKNIPQGTLPDIKNTYFGNIPLENIPSKKVNLYKQRSRFYFT